MHCGDNRHKLYLWQRIGYSTVRGHMIADFWLKYSCDRSIFLYTSWLSVEVEYYSYISANVLTLAHSLTLVCHTVYDTFVRGDTCIAVCGAKPRVIPDNLNSILVTQDRDMEEDCHQPQCVNRFLLPARIRCNNLTIQKWQIYFISIRKLKGSVRDKVQLHCPHTPHAYHLPEM